MPSNSIFLDTSGRIALLNGRDTDHALAVKVWRNLAERGVSVVLSNWIMAETGNGLARTPLRSKFVSAARLGTTSPMIQLIEVAHDLLGRAIDLDANRPDKVWGLVDCSSFVIMNDLGIRDALTADRHFEQAGFRCLLKGVDEFNGR